MTLESLVMLFIYGEIVIHPLHPTWVWDDHIHSVWWTNLSHNFKFKVFIKNIKVFYGTFSFSLYD